MKPYYQALDPVGSSSQTMAGRYLGFEIQSPQTNSPVVGL
jgi:hypothetical protein